MFSRLLSSSLPCNKIRFTKSTIRCFHNTYTNNISVTSEMVKELRQKSGAPMMDCKKALSAIEVNGDITLAINWLRAKGIAKAATNSDRITKEGLIIVNKNNSKGFITILEINSETDFVSMNKDFQLFVSLVSETISQKCPQEGVVSIPDLMKQTIDAAIISNSSNTNELQVNDHNTSKTNTTLHDALGDIISSIRENIVIKRAMNIYPDHHSTTTGSVVVSYTHGKVGLDITPTHIELGKVAAVVKLEIQSTNNSNNDLIEQLNGSIGKKLAMHIVAAQPAFLSVKDVPVEIIEKETLIFREQTADDGKKKPEMIEKIVTGKVAKRLSEICLLSQTHVAVEGSPMIQKYLDTLQLNTKVNITSFERWTLG